MCVVSGTVPNLESFFFSSLLLSSNNHCRGPKEEGVGQGWEKKKDKKKKKENRKANRYLTVLSGQDTK